MHAQATLAFAQQGYHILSEKPMATTVDDCLRIERLIKNTGVIFGIGHGKFSRVCLELLLNLVDHSATLLRIYESFIRHRTQEHSWRSGEYCPRGAYRLLPLCTLLCAWKLGGSRGELLCVDD